MAVCTENLSKQARHFKVADFDFGQDGWSLSPIALEAAFNSVKWPLDHFRLLEVGAGALTPRLADRLLAERAGGLFNRLTYVSYESNPDWAERARHPAVNLIVHETGNRWPASLLDGVYDLVVIDGPNGVVRERWYAMLPPHVRSGTVLLIDDFNHYAEFETALNAAFPQHTVLARFDRFPWGGESWRVVRID